MTRCGRWQSRQVAGEAWTGQAMGARHGPTLQVGLDAIGGTVLNVGVALERDFDRTHHTSEVGVRAQTTSFRFLLGGQWPLGHVAGCYARAGAGLDATRVAPTHVRESAVRLRDGLTTGAWVSFDLDDPELEERIDRPELRAVFCQRGALRELSPTSPPPDSSSYAGRCWGTLEEVQDSLFTDCPATADATAAWLDSCEGVSVLPWLSGYSGSCHGLLVAMVSWGTHAQACYYDETSRELVGAEVTDDVAWACNGSSTSLVGGEYPAAPCPLTDLTDLGPCDAGAGGSGG